MNRGDENHRDCFRDLTRGWEKMGEGRGERQPVWANCYHSESEKGENRKEGEIVLEATEEAGVGCACLRSLHLGS